MVAVESQRYLRKLYWICLLSVSRWIGRLVSSKKDYLGCLRMIQEVRASYVSTLFDSFFVSTCHFFMGVYLRAIEYNFVSSILVKQICSLLVCLVTVLVRGTRLNKYDALITVCFEHKLL